jgi:hypothetical protein
MQTRFDQYDSRKLLDVLLFCGTRRNRTVVSVPRVLTLFFGSRTICCVYFL